MEQSFVDAVKAGNVDEVRRLVQGTPALAGTKDGNGVSAILVATYHGRRDAAVALVGPHVRCQGSDPHFHQMVDWGRSSLSFSVAFSGSG